MGLRQIHFDSSICLGHLLELTIKLTLTFDNTWYNTRYNTCGTPSHNMNVGLLG